MGRIAGRCLRSEVTGMIQLGEVQSLEIVAVKEFGVYLGSRQEKVLLPKKQVPENAKTGDKIKVFVYRDSRDRLIATTREPLVTLGHLAVLKVNQVGKIGAFLDWGLEKDLFLPFKEQTEPAVPGKSYLVALYIDKSERLAATMKVHRYLSAAEEYEKDDTVTGIIYEINETIGAFVAVDNRFYGLIPHKEIHEKYAVGQVVEARVTDVREDGKLNLSPKKKAYLQMDEDAEAILKVIREYGGTLPYNDKAAPEIISRDFKMSKNAFKRGVGRLLKEGKIAITENGIDIR